MNILVVGGGGREHAIAHCLSKSPLTKNLIVAPGNPGIKKFAECYPISADDIEGQCKLAKDKNIDLVFIGPEIPLVLGLKDKLSEIGIKAFGPSAKAAQLEGSKTFSRNFCKRNNIPQPDFIYCNDIKTAKNRIELLNGYCVVKADGLAAGKGVVVCDTVEEAINASTQMLENNKFGDAGKSILIEERITGIEASIFAVSDGDTAIILGTAQDHKRAFDNDQGPNTGGMGAISPAPALNDSLNQEIFNKIIIPTINGMKSDGIVYEGILYAGIMLTKDGPKVIEFNCRFGDPETQPILFRLKSSLVQLCLYAIEDKLDLYESEWDERHSCGVVIASEGYPEKYLSNQEVEIQELNSDTMKLFHAGTTLENNKVMTSGGRVFCATALGVNLKEAQTSAYNLVNSISFNGAFCRKDIGYKGIK